MTLYTIVSQRLSRGFHRLGLFLAAILLIVGGWFSVLTAKDEASMALHKHQQLVCAHEHIAQAKPLLPDVPKGMEPGDVLPSSPGQEPWQLNWQLNLKQVGCSDYSDDIVTYGEASNPPEFSWLGVFAQTLGLGLAITLAVTVVIYGQVRAIGWVIDGFTAS
jgi:hypothetical protein